MGMTIANLMKKQFIVLVYKLIKHHFMCSRNKISDNDHNPDE